MKVTLPQLVIMKKAAARTGLFAQEIGMPRNSHGPCPQGIGRMGVVSVSVNLSSHSPHLRGPFLFEGPTP